MDSFNTNFFTISVVNKDKNGGYTYKRPANMLYPWKLRLLSTKHHIYFTPASEDDNYHMHYIMIDDITDTQKALELKPSTIIETSPANHQVWYYLPFIKTWEQKKALCKRLTDYLGGDQAAIKAKQTGRLPGTLNCKHDSLPEVRCIYTSRHECDMTAVTAVAPQRAVKNPNRQTKDNPVIKDFKLIRRWIETHAATNGWISQEAIRKDSTFLPRAKGYLRKYGSLLAQHDSNYLSQTIESAITR